MSDDEGPLGFLRRKLREAGSDGAADAWTLRKRIAEILHAPQWESAALRMHAVSECKDDDSPWLVCKPCNAAGRCAKEFDPAAIEALRGRLRADPAFALETLQAAGIATDEGKLSDRFA